MKHKSDYGVIEYRLPDNFEAIELLGIMELEPDLDEEMANKKQFLYLARLIKGMGFLIEKVDLKVDEKKIKSYEDMKTERCLVGDLMSIGAKVMESLNITDKKKP